MCRTKKCQAGAPEVTVPKSGSQHDAGSDRSRSRHGSADEANIGPTERRRTCKRRTTRFPTGALRKSCSRRKKRRGRPRRPWQADHASNGLACRPRVGRIRAETSDALGKITKEVSGQWKNRRRQMEQLSAQVAEGQAHTEHVWQQVVAAGHTADTRHAESSKKQSELSEQVDRLTSIIERMMGSGAASSGSPMETDGDAPAASPRPAQSSSSQTSTAGDTPDRSVIRAKTHALP